MVTSDSTPNTWAHIAAKGVQNQHRNDDNRIEVIPQKEPNDQSSGSSPSVDDLMNTGTPLDIGGQQQDPSHQRKHELSPQDEDADITTCTVPQEVISVDAEMTAFDDRHTRHTMRPLHANTQGAVSREWEGNDAAPVMGKHKWHTPIKPKAQQKTEDGQGDTLIKRKGA